MRALRKARHANRCASLFLCLALVVAALGILGTAYAQHRYRSTARSMPALRLDNLTRDEREAVQTALRRIADGERPPYAGKWGIRHGNREGKLPTAFGLTYREYYLPKADGDSTRWGARRLIVGSDSKAYFTRDHYRTFIRVR